MPYALRTHECPDCGVKHARRAPADPPARCVPCRIAFSAEVVRQMHAKEGPYWDKWVWQQALWVRRHAKEPPQIGASRVA